MTSRSTFFFTSSSARGAQNVSADGSRFDISLGSPLVIPSTAKGLELAVTGASISNTSPNISGAVGFQNNNFRYTTAAAPAGSYDITIPEGLYSLSGLNSYLSAQFVNNGHPAGLFVLSGNDATQQSVITFSSAGDSIDFSVPNSLGTLLGFSTEAGDNPIVAPVDGYNAFSQEVARFNRVTQYTLSTNLIDGLAVNGSASSGVIAVIPITAPPGSIINYDPRQLTWVPCPELAGVQRTNFSFQLADQDLRPTPTSGEIFTFVLQLRWQV